ncbi:MAG TPA: hypothetical protein VGK67_32000 [Myxococcales bacterium]|jgi:hypothetical protein
MVPVRKLADLALSAASGVVRLGQHLLVVADDELFLDAYADDGRRSGRIALRAKAPLPEEHQERKRLKPDLEALVVLPGRRVLAVGSGSTDRRRTAYLFEAPAEGALPGFRGACDLSLLYAHLSERFPELNIEGAAVAGGKLRLLQRGNGARGQNAVIDLALDGVLEALTTRVPLAARLVLDVRPVQLPPLGKVRLGFTDASPIAEGDPRIMFVAAAEDTDDPYLDGECAGSAIGVLDEKARVEWLEPLEGKHKVEGVIVEPGGTRALLVAHPDDREQRAPLLECSLT